MGFSSISFSIGLLIAVILICIKAIRALPRRGFNFFDPGLILVLYITVNILPIAIISIFDFGKIQEITPRIGDQELLSKVILAHAIFLASLTFSYMTLSISYRTDLKDRFNKIAISKIWFLLPCLFILLDFLFQRELGLFRFNPWALGGKYDLSHAVRSIGILNLQIYNKIVLLETLLLIFAIGVIAARSPTLRLARIRLFVTLFILFAVHYFLTTERGFILVIGLGAAAYADMVRWKGNLLNLRLVLIIIAGGLAISLITNTLESIITYGYIESINKLTVANILTLKTAPPWITSTIISWIDNADIPLQYGQNYLNAIKGILPSQVYGGPMDTLAKWFVKRLLPSRAEMGLGMGFSAIAEGYLNAKMFGVFIHGIIIGLFAGAIRSFQVSKRFRMYGAFFYSALLASFYKVYHEGSMVILSNFLWTTLGTIFLICLTHIMLIAAKNEENSHAKMP